MRTITRKDYEFQQRERYILSVARELLKQYGYTGLTIERVAEASEYSRPTIYQHFSSKEEVIMGIAIESAQERAEAFAMVRDFDARPREKLYLMGYLLSKLYPQHLESEIVFYVTDVRGRTSPARQRVLAEREHEAFQIAVDVINEAANKGDFSMPPNMRAENIAFILWSLYLGGFAISNLSKAGLPLENFAIDKYIGSVNFGGDLILDALNWRPLSHEWDYPSTLERAKRELFPKELR